MKKLLCALIAISLLLSLVACGSVPASSVSTEVSPDPLGPTSEVVGGDSSVNSEIPPVYANEHQTVDVSGSWEIPVLTLAKRAGDDTIDYESVDFLSFAEGLGYTFARTTNMIWIKKEGHSGIHFQDFNGTKSSVRITIGADGSEDEGVIAYSQLSFNNSECVWDGQNWLLADGLKYALINFLLDVNENMSVHAIRWFQYDATPMLTDDLRNLIEAHGYRAYVDGTFETYVYVGFVRNLNISFISETPDEPAIKLVCEGYDDSYVADIEDNGFLEGNDLALKMKVFQVESDGSAIESDTAGIEGQAFVFNGRLLMTDDYFTLIETTLL